MITAAEQRSRGRGRRPFFVTPTFGPKGIARRCSCPRCRARAEELSVPSRCAMCRRCGCTSDLPRCKPLEAPQRASGGR